MSETTALRKSGKQPITLGEKTYGSITEFCLEYGLKYTSVIYHLNKGRTPEEIVDLLGALPTSTRYKDTSQRACKCSYDGVEYPSITVASEALGIPSYMVYMYKNQKKVSADEALQMVMSQMRADDAEFEEEVIDNKRSCVVEGVRYKSKGEALKAYGIPYQTVRSRMIRDGLSFEEALRKGKDERRRLEVQKSRWNILSPAASVPEEKTEVMTQIEDILNKKAYTTHCLEDKENGIDAIFFLEKLQAFAEPKTVYLLFDRDYARGGFIEIEFVIPELLKVGRLSLEQKAELLMLLNDMNNEFLGAKVALVNERIQVNWSIALKSRINIRILLRTLHRFIGVAVTIYEAVLGYEQ